MKNRKLFFFLILVFIIGIFFYGLLTGKKQVQESPSQRRLPQPKIPEYIKGELPIKMVVRPEDFIFPSQLPLLKVSPYKITEEEALQIAENLDFTEKPLITQDYKEGTKYIWSSPDYFLFVTPSTGTFKYGVAIPHPPEVADKKLDNEAITKTAQDFLVDNFAISQENIKPSSIVYYSVNEKSEGYSKTEKKDAQVYQVNFTYKNSDFEILTLIPEKPLIFVQILPDGSVFSLQIIKLETVESTGEKFVLKNYQELVANLPKAKLITLLNDYVNIADLSKGQIGTIEVEKISLAYLLDSPTSKELQPIFLLEGKTLVINSEADYAQLYIPAVKTP